MNPVIVSIANKVAFAIAAYLVHRGAIAANVQTSVENDIVGVLLGAFSIGLTVWTSLQHKNANAVVAQVAITHPEAVEAAQIAVNSKTPNGLGGTPIDTGGH